MCKPYLLFLHSPSSAKDCLLSPVKGSVPCVLEAERTDVIPNALGSIFHCKNPHGSPRASSVDANGSYTTRTSAKKSGTAWDRASLQWQCSSSGKLVVSFSPGCYRQVKGAPTGSMHTMSCMKGTSESCEIH